MPHAEKNQTENYNADILKIKNFIVENHASLLVIGTNSPDAKYLYKTLKDNIVNDENIITRLGHEP